MYEEWYKQSLEILVTAFCGGDQNISLCFYNVIEADGGHIKNTLQQCQG
jgi:hypothetical protein